MNQELTIPDLVVLRFLWDSPMHGYELNKTLEICEVRDWAAISKPQVYYSLKKLHRLELLAAVPGAGPSGGPGKQVLKITAAGKAALRSNLASAEWILERPPPPFITWLALSPRATTAAAQRQIIRRKQFLQDEIARERVTLRDMKGKDGPDAALVVLMVELTIEQFEMELRWLRRVQRHVRQQGGSRRRAGRK